MTASPAGSYGSSRLAPTAPGTLRRRQPSPDPAPGALRRRQPSPDPAPTAAPLPRRAPADPTDEAERLGDWGLLTAVLDGLTADELESCPGMLVVHVDGRLECLEGDRCPPDLVMHPGTATCAEVLSDCC